MKNNIPQSLRNWFLIHFIVDIILGIPLIFFPEIILQLFGLPGTQAESILARLVGAALLGIGGVSFFSYKKSKESFDTLLTMKIIWSTSAILGLLISISVGAPSSLWILVAIFVVFSLAWIYYKRKI